MVLTMFGCACRAPTVERGALWLLLAIYGIAVVGWVEAMRATERELLQHPAREGTRDGR